MSLFPGVFVLDVFVFGRLCFRRLCFRTSLFQTSLFPDVFVLDVFVSGRFSPDFFFQTSFAVASYNGICPYSWPAGLHSGCLFSYVFSLVVFADVFSKRLCFRTSFFAGTFFPGVFILHRIFCNVGYVPRERIPLVGPSRRPQTLNIWGVFLTGQIKIIGRKEDHWSKRKRFGPI